MAWASWHLPSSFTAPTSCACGTTPAAPCSGAGRPVAGRGVALQCTAVTWNLQPLVLQSRGARSQDGRRMGFPVPPADAATDLLQLVGPIRLLHCWICAAASQHLMHSRAGSQTSRVRWGGHAAAPGSATTAAARRRAGLSLLTHRHHWAARIVGCTVQSMCASLATLCARTAHRHHWAERVRIVGCTVPCRAGAHRRVG